MLPIESTIKRISSTLKIQDKVEITRDEWEIIKNHMCHDNFSKLNKMMFCFHEDIEHIHEENSFPYGDTIDYDKCRSCRCILPLEKNK